MVDKIKLFWCQKVLPLVYDDSLSYYEVLCKLRAKINEVIELLNETAERVSSIEELLIVIEERITACEEGIAGLEMRVDALESDIEELRERIITCEGDIDDLQTRMNNAEERLDALEECCETVTGILPDGLGEPGQTIVVNSGGTGTEWADPPTGLPSVLGTRGQVLTVNSSETSAIWADVPEELPPRTGNANRPLVVKDNESGVEWDPNTTIDDGKIVSISNTGEKVEIDAAGDIKYYNSSNNVTGIYTHNALSFLQTNDIGVYNAEGCGFEPFDEVGSHSIPVQTDRIYLVTFVDRARYQDDTNDGIWLVYTNDGLYGGQSKILTIKSSAAATLTINVLTLTITRTCQYGKMTWTRLG